MIFRVYGNVKITNIKFATTRKRKVTPRKTTLCWYYHYYQHNVIMIQ